MANLIWLQKEFPWLGRGFVHAVADAHADQFGSDLAELGFNVSTMRCGPSDDLHSELARVFRFPDYYGKNWDAFDECIAEAAVETPFALIWRGAGGYAAAHPKLYAEASFMLLEAFDRLSDDQAILVITGDGATFAAPAQA